MRRVIVFLCVCGEEHGGLFQLLDLTFHLERLDFFFQVSAESWRKVPAASDDRDRLTRYRQIKYRRRTSEKQISASRSKFNGSGLLMEEWSVIRILD